MRDDPLYRRPRILVRRRDWILGRKAVLNRYGQAISGFDDLREEIGVNGGERGADEPSSAVDVDKQRELVATCGEFGGLMSEEETDGEVMLW